MVFIGNIGGDGGGWWIDANGHVHHVDPWTPDVLLAAQAVSLLAQAAGRAAKNEYGVALTETLGRLATLVSGQIEGHISAGAGALYER